MCAAVTRPAMLLGQALQIGSSPYVDPLDFRVTVFRSGLNFPTSMQRLSDGSLLVATSDPSGSLFNSTGTLVRLVDANGDGVADAAPQALYTGLPGVLTSVRQAGSLILATSSQAGTQQISFLRAGATPASALTLLGTMNFSFPAGWQHTTYALAVRPAPGAPNAYEVYFNIGAQGNSTGSTGSVGMQTSGLAGLTSGTVAGDAIYRVRVDNSAATPAISQLEQVASGVRNASGMGFHPVSGDFYFTENGIDTPGNQRVSLSADELNTIPLAGLTSGPHNFGFPDTYIDYQTGAQVGATGIPPVAAFLPLSPTERSEGAVELAFAPQQFPQGVNNGVFVGFYGDGTLAGPANQENAVVYYDFGRDEYLHFIGVNQPGMGHPDGLLATADSLFIADLSSTGQLTSAGTGVIYQVTALPPPIPGDANRDGIVDAADFTLWADNYGKAANFSNGDFNRDGFVDVADFTLWADNYSPSMLAVAVPEPASIGLGALGLLSLALWRGVSVLRCRSSS